MRTSGGERHRMLIVEDDRALLRFLVPFFETHGFDVRVETCVQGALKALEEEVFCLLIVDQQLPFDDNPMAVPYAGETIFRAARKKDASHTADGLWFRLQLIAMTNYSGASAYVSRVHQAGADAFFEKPDDWHAHVGELLAIVERCLARAARADHAQCLALAPPEQRVAAEAAAREGAVRLAIDGTHHRRRSVVLIDDDPCDMQDAVFVFLLRLVANQMRAPGVYFTREALGIGEQRHLVRDLNKALADAVPVGFSVVDGDGSRRFRLNAGVVIERVDWVTLAKEHPHDAVKRLAQEMVKLTR